MRSSNSFQEQQRCRIPFKQMMVLSIIIVCAINVTWRYSRTTISGLSLASLRAVISDWSGDSNQSPHLSFPQPRVKTNHIDKSKESSVTKLKQIHTGSGRRHRLGRMHEKNQTIPIYYVNMNGAKERRNYIESHLKEHQLRAVRVAAIESIEYVSITAVSALTMANPNNIEIACIASHLIAIHTAVNDRSFFQNSPFAIIIEDDVKFEFSVNWNELLYNAPQDFDVLQLMTSNYDSVVTMAEYYKSAAVVAIKIGLRRNFSHPDDTKHAFLWHPRQRGSYIWSTQAYAIHKPTVRQLINEVVVFNRTTGQYAVTLRNTATQMSYCRPGNKACKRLYPFRLVADTYLYDLLGKAYTLRLPLLNGAQGFRSDIQPEVVDKLASAAFLGISDVVEYVRDHSDGLLPTGLLL